MCSTYGSPVVAPLYVRCVNQPQARCHFKLDSSSKWLASISTCTWPSEGEEVRNKNTQLGPEGRKFHIVPLYMHISSTAPEYSMFPWWQKILKNECSGLEIKIGHDLWQNSHAKQCEIGIWIDHSSDTQVIRNLFYSGKQTQPNFLWKHVVMLTITSKWPNPFCSSEMTYTNI